MPPCARVAPAGCAPILDLQDDVLVELAVKRRERVEGLAHELLRYSSHTARSGLGLARVVRLFVWPRHANGMSSTTPLDPCAYEMSAQGGNTRRTLLGAVVRVAVHECAPHDDPAVRAHRPRDKVRPVRLF